MNRQGAAQWQNVATAVAWCSPTTHESPPARRSQNNQQGLRSAAATFYPDPAQAASTNLFWLTCHCTWEPSIFFLPPDQPLGSERSPKVLSPLWPVAGLGSSASDRGDLYLCAITSGYAASVQSPGPLQDSSLPAAAGQPPLASL